MLLRADQNDATQNGNYLLRVEMGCSLVEEFLEFLKTGLVDVIARCSGLALFVPGNDVWVFGEIETSNI